MRAPQTRRYPPRSRVGTVYLIHFSHPYWHARHYVGFSTRLEARIREHRRGMGSPLIAAALECGIEIFIARRWENVTRAFERRIHRMHHGRRGCPICRGPRAHGRGGARRAPHTGGGG
jgi:predicted GIY-YIG superfamily endonuclease